MSGNACPPEGTLGRLLEGRMDDGERARVERHAAECPDCRLLLVLSARAVEEGVRSTSWRRRAAVITAAAAIAAVVILYALLPARRDVEVARTGMPVQRDAGFERTQISAAMKGLVASGYSRIEVARLVARSAGAGIRGQDMVELVRAMEKAASGGRDPSRLRDEVLEAAAGGAAGPELRRTIQERLQKLPILNPKQGKRQDGIGTMAG